MNEKIKEFAKQAWPGLPSHWWDSRDGAEAVEKFAELIVKDCGAVALNIGCGDIEDELLKHFGVK